MKNKIIAILIASTLVLASCANPAAQTSQPPVDTEAVEVQATTATTDQVIPAESPALTVDQLKNASYSGIYDQPVVLVNGLYEGKPLGADDASHPIVQFIDDAVLFGDLDQDGDDDAVVFLLDRGGGSGVFTFISAQLNQNGLPTDAGAIMIEDRIGVKSLALENDHIVLEIITQGPGDAACCGSHKAQKMYALQDGKLVEIPPEDNSLERITESELVNSSWQLIELNYDQPVLADVDVTINFNDDQISGIGSCNNYNASYSMGQGNPLVMTTSPIASTRMACPDPIAAQETAYFMALENVSQWGYAFGRLALFYKSSDGTLGRLLFLEQAPAESLQEDTLLSQTWQWVSFTNPVEMYKIDNPENYTLLFNTDGTVNIKADCNLANSSFTDENGSLQIQPGPMTLAQCPPDSRSDQFIQYLNAAARYFFQDGNLYIDLFADGGTMEFTPAGTSPATSLPDPVVAKLDAFLQELVMTENTDPGITAPGLVLLVDTPDVRYLQAAGVSSMENGTPMQIDDRLEIGSNSKSFTIVLLMQLQEEGVLSMDDPLSVWLPEWAAKIPNGDQMTLRQLAQHTAGIWDYGDPIIGDAANNPDKLQQGYTPEELVQYAIDNGTPDFAPGEEGQWKYSNTGYILIGMILEKATGKSLGTLYQERIFTPLGLETATFIEGVPEPGEITNGYWWTDDGEILNTTFWNVSQGWAAGGIAMTAEDLLKYARALSAGDLFQNPDSLSEMLTFDPNGMNGIMPYGLGLMNFALVGAPGSWGHEGQTAGFQSLWYTNPETNITVVGLSNSAKFSAYKFLDVAGMISSTEIDG